MDAPQENPASDPNATTASALGKRSPSGSPAKPVVKKRVINRNNRRVSFAPDPELTTIHQFEKDDDNSGPLSPLVAARAFPGEPAAGAAGEVPESPGMDLTRPVGAPAWRASLGGAGGDVTAGLPSLAALAEADELFDGARGRAAAAALPAFGDFAEEDEAAAAAADGAAGRLDEDFGFAAAGNAGAADAMDITLAAGGGAAAARPSPALSAPLSTVAGASGQLRRWGFVPGDDDTLATDLAGRGRRLLGDSTFARVYAGGEAPGHAAGRAAGAAGAAGAAPRAAAAAFGDADEGGGALGAPDWAAPAFLPPYLAAEHPALARSPGGDATESSLGTLDTRRASLAAADARRASVSSRRASHAAAAAAARPRGRPSDATGNLLAESGPEAGLEAGVGLGAGAADGMLAGLQQQLRLMSQGSPAAGRAAALEAALARTPAAPAPAGPEPACASSRDPRTAALLRTGGTTGLLGGGAATGPLPAPAGAAGAGTARLLREDAGARASSAAFLGRAAPSPEHTGPLMSMGPPPPRHSYAPSPAPSGSVGRLMGGGASVHSLRSAPLFGGGGGAAATPQAMMGRFLRSPASAQPPGSALGGRYPGRYSLGQQQQWPTPSFTGGAQPPPITFGDFAKLADVAFLDNLRRGASINYADLQPNAVPEALPAALRLLCVTAPAVAELETAVGMLQGDARRLRAGAAEAEVLLGQANPPIFRHVQAAGPEQLEAFRANVAALKKVCRARAVSLLKDMRCQMEESRAARLARNADALRADLEAAREAATLAAEVAKRAEAWAEQRAAALAAAAAEAAADAARRRRLAAARAALAEERGANAERRRRLDDARALAAALREERAALAAARAAAEAEAADLSAAAAAARGADGAFYAGEPAAALARLRRAEALQAALGWALESASADGAALRVGGGAFRLRLAATPAGVRAAVELAPPAAGPGAAGAAARAALAAALAAAAGAPPGGAPLCVDPAGAPAAVQALAARLARAAELAADLGAARAALPALLEAGPAPGGGARLVFVNLEAEVRFGATLRAGAALSPLAPLRADAVRVWFSGEGQVTPAAVEAAVAGAGGRLADACAALSALAMAAAPRPRGGAAVGAAAGAAEPAFNTAFGNPLFA